MTVTGSSIRTAPLKWLTGLLGHLFCSMIQERRLGWTKREGLGEKGRSKPRKYPSMMFAQKDQIYQL